MRPQKLGSGWEWEQKTRRTLRHGECWPTRNRTGAVAGLEGSEGVRDQRRSKKRDKEGERRGIGGRGRKKSHKGIRDQVRRKRAVQMGVQSWWCKIGFCSSHVFPCK